MAQGKTYQRPAIVLASLGFHAVLLAGLTLIHGREQGFALPEEVFDVTVLPRYLTPEEQVRQAPTRVKLHRSEDEKETPEVPPRILPLPRLRRPDRRLRRLPASPRNSWARPCAMAGSGATRRASRASAARRGRSARRDWLRGPGLQAILAMEWPGTSRRPLIRLRRQGTPGGRAQSPPKWAMRMCRLRPPSCETRWRLDAPGTPRRTGPWGRSRSRRSPLADLQHQNDQQG